MKYNASGLAVNAANWMITMINSPAYLDKYSEILSKQRNKLKQRIISLQIKPRLQIKFNYDSKKKM